MISPSRAKPGLHAAPRYELRDLHLNWPDRHGGAAVVRGVSLAVAGGEVLGVVGESGSGKSLALLAPFDLIPGTPPQMRCTEARFEGSSLLEGERPCGRSLLGRGVGVILQDPMSALHPMLSVGKQVEEAVPEAVQGAQQRALAVREALNAAGLPEAESLARAYPHTLSGGMRQRVVIAMALAGRSRLLIADEPTTALDVTVQAKVLKTLRGLVEAESLALILVTHDLGVIAETADRVAVLYAGQVVEEGPVQRLFSEPRHPYTQALLAARPPAQPSLRVQAPKCLGGLPPAPAERAAGCAFAPRCSQAQPGCREDVPPLTSAPGSRGQHRVRCPVTTPPASATKASEEHTP